MVMTVRQREQAEARREVEREYGPDAPTYRHPAFCEAAGEWGHAWEPRGGGDDTTGVCRGCGAIRGRVFT